MHGILARSVSRVRKCSRMCGMFKRRHKNQQRGGFPGRLIFCGVRRVKSDFRAQVLWCLSVLDNGIQCSNGGCGSSLELTIY